MVLVFRLEELKRGGRGEEEIFSTVSSFSTRKTRRGKRADPEWDRLSSYVLVSVRFGSTRLDSAIAPLSPSLATSSFSYTPSPHRSASLLPASPPLPPRLPLGTSSQIDSSPHFNLRARSSFSVPLLPPFFITSPFPFPVPPFFGQCCWFSFPCLPFSIRL